MSMFMKPCVVCGTKVDTDNGFGHVPDNEVYCDKHFEIGRKKSEYVAIVKKINSLQKDKLKIENELLEMRSAEDGKENLFVIRQYSFFARMLECNQRNKTAKHGKDTTFTVGMEQIPQDIFHEIIEGISEGHMVQIMIKFKISKTSMNLIQNKKDEEPK